MTRITVLGIGSFVFGPSFLHELLAECRMGDVQLTLIDVDPDAARRAHRVASRLAQGLPDSPVIHARTTLPDDEPPADIVVCAAAPRVGICFEQNAAICAQLDPSHKLTEFSGVHGMDYAIRQCHFIRAVARWMKRRCPDAWLLNVTNPLPRVCEAAAHEGIRTVGFCSASLGIYQWVGHKAGLGHSTYPFAPARERFHAITAGFNHCTYLLQLIDHHAGQDIWPDVRERWLAPGTPTPDNWQLAERAGRAVGHVLATNDHHTRDFTPFAVDWHSATETQHGSAEQRRAVLERLDAFADGTLPWEAVGTPVGWERPATFLHAIRTGQSAAFTALNLPNDGWLPGLPDALYTETPARIVNGRLQRDLPTPSAMVADALDAIGRWAQQQRQAILHHDPDALRAALAMDPTVQDPDRAMRALGACLFAHADLVPAELIERLGDPASATVQAARRAF